MQSEPLSPDNAAVLLADYAVGFADLIRSHEMHDHLAAVTGLARMALLYGAPVVVTNGEESKPSGPLYPELLKVIGDQPVIVRSPTTAFNAFLEPKFVDAVEATGRRRLIIAGVATEGCVLQSALGAVRLGYEVNVVVDACGSLGREPHEMALRRMTMAGVIPLTWWSLAAEFQLGPRFAAAPYRNDLMAEFQPAMTMAARAFAAGVELGRHGAGVPASA
jgi:nicotinamidase-related amidase